jgi:hypothetical protein
MSWDLVVVHFLTLLQCLEPVQPLQRFHENPSFILDKHWSVKERNQFVDAFLESEVLRQGHYRAFLPPWDRVLKQSVFTLSLLPPDAPLSLLLPPSSFLLLPPSPSPFLPPLSLPVPLGMLARVYQWIPCSSSLQVEAVSFTQGKEEGGRREGRREGRRREEETEMHEAF